VAAARFYYQFAPANEKSNMVGVIMYDVSNTGGAATGSALSNALDKLPATIPVLNIAAEPLLLNTFGNANPVLADKRVRGPVVRPGDAHRDLRLPG
jgi:hypothetical protein